MENLQYLLEEVIRLGIPGDFIETGVWRGGASILAATIFKAYGQNCPSLHCRRVFVADSFAGIPPVNVAKYPADAAHVGSDNLPILRDNSEDRVKATFSRFGVLSDSVHWLKGWFKDTLPPARSAFTSLAVMRLDGDTYESTWQALENLYDRVSPGGFVIVDDYTDWVGCRLAVDEFRSKVGATSGIFPVYHGVSEVVRGVWWRK
jgi:O-methyltransferase